MMQEEVHEFYKSKFGLSQLSPLLQSANDAVQIEYAWDAKYSFYFMRGYVSVIKTNKWRRGVLILEQRGFVSSSIPVDIRSDYVMNTLKKFDLTINEEKQVLLDGGDRFVLQLVTTMLSCKISMNSFHFFENKKWRRLSGSISGMMRVIARKEQDHELRKELKHLLDTAWEL